MHGEMVTGVFLALVLLFTAAVIALLSKRLRIPYTILLVIIGLVLGWASRTVPGLAVLTLFELTPGVVLYVFLPVLIFETSFNLDVRSLIKNLTPIMLLAVPGVLISTALVGGITCQVLGLPIGVALLFGALISATDPVAVIALFREMGAPKRLTMLVEGESLFNDGTALVLFKILLTVAAAGALSVSTVAEGAVSFIIVFMGGVAVGIVTGFLFSNIIGAVENNRLVEITLTTILAHMTFLLAEHYLHVSGVMATVAAGLTLGSYGRSKISPPVLEHLEMFWDYAAYVCNSLIFLLVGLSIDLGRFAADAWAVLGTVVVVLAARAAAVYTLFPLLGRFRRIEPVDRKFQTIIVWGGLRGVLAIAMVVSIPDAVEQKPLLMNLTLGIVLFTLLVNGLTMRKLMSRLALDRFSLQDRLESLQAMLFARQQARKGLVGDAEGGMIARSVVQSERKRYDREIAAVTDALRKLTSHADMAVYRDEVEMILRHALLIEKMAYHDLFVQGLLSEKNLKELHHRIDRQLDRVKEGRDLPAMKGEERMFGRAEEMLLRTASGIPFLKAILRRYKTGRIAASYERKRARLMAVRTVLRKLDEMEAQRTYDAGPIARAREFYSVLAERTRERIRQMSLVFPEFVEKVETMILRREGLNREMTVLRGQYAEGMLSEKTMHALDAGIRTRLRMLRMRPVLELQMPAPALLRKFPFFRELPEEDLRHILTRTALSSFMPDEEIVREGDRDDAMFLIGRGIVEVVKQEEDGWKTILARLGPGEFFGEIALLHPVARTATVRAVTPCTLLELRRDQILPLLDHAPALARAFETAYRERVLMPMLAHVPLLGSLDESVRRELADEMEHIRFKEGDILLKAGSRIDRICVIRSGEAEVLRKDIRETVLVAGDHVGGDVLPAGQASETTVRAITSMEVYVLRKESLDRVLKNN